MNFHEAKNNADELVVSPLLYLPNAGIMVDASRMSRRKRGRGIGEILVASGMEKMREKEKIRDAIIEYV